jgi:short-chain fatty acids transporter
VPSGGSKWVIETRYVMEAAHQLRVHLGSVGLRSRRSTSEPDPAVLDVAGARRISLRARDILGYTFVVFLALMPVVILLVTPLGRTLSYPL